MGRGHGEKHIPDARMSDGVLAPGRKDCPGEGETGCTEATVQTNREDGFSEAAAMPPGYQQWKMSQRGAETNGGLVP